MSSLYSLRSLCLCGGFAATELGSLAIPDHTRPAAHSITTRAAEELPPHVTTQLDKLSRRIYRALGLTGYARMDFRVAADGQVYVLEANANPNLEAEEDFAESARAAGVAYDDLLGRLIALGLSYQAEWRAYYG